ncbi:hypothetical protein J6590_064259 [Homalodisca vitripennis]|nr:hypothetical protein J6590_064259 [Homalodisca vitripennis]
MYVGVHLPGEKRHRKHKHSRANSRDSDEDERPTPLHPPSGLRLQPEPKPSLVAESAFVPRLSNCLFLYVNSSEIV